jgi:hypothetical protein
MTTVKYNCNSAERKPRTGYGPRTLGVLAVPEGGALF